MEGRPHNRRRYSPVGRMSRTERDLSNCPQGSDSSFESIKSDMLRCGIPRASSAMKSKVPHVCIVGAGFAGLRCAEILVERGIKVTMFEGRDRTGGRVCHYKVLFEGS
jgi:NADPH-dependent 2,4-dienoyl-CoA reductase/sulfur reductase-like enzyme